VWGNAVSSPSPGKFGFWSLSGPQKSRQNGQLAFESEGATSESGGGGHILRGHVPPCPNVELLQVRLLQFAKSKLLGIVVGGGMMPYLMPIKALKNAS